MEPESEQDSSKLTWWQRAALRRLRKRAGKPGAEPLSEEDWAAMWELQRSPMTRAVRRVMVALPSSPRCAMCGAPFAGVGAHIVRPLGYRPSRKNPTLCETCVESTPPGGATVETGVMFADLRGFTAHSEGRSPSEVSATLRRFYGCAEEVLFPEAVIDKLIGDEVMALYLSRLLEELGSGGVPQLMVDHARELLEAIGYGSEEGPFVDVGIGLDFGDAYVGNIGDRAVYDFTAVGDVVNTAARLQGEAGGGEIVFSERVAAGLPSPVGERTTLELKGKSEPTVAFRLAVGGSGPAQARL